MDSTPPYHNLSRSEPPKSQIKSAEKLPHLSICLIAPSPKRALPSPSTPSVPLHELLLLSPSPLRKSSKACLADRLEMAEDAAAAAESVGSRRRCKSRASQLGLLGCASPRNVRRPRRRSELELSREEKDLGFGDEGAKPRKRRHSVRSKKEKLSLVPSSSLPSSTSSLSPKMDEDIQDSLDQIGQLTSDLVMWRDVAKSSLWFGIGSLFFFSSCFAQGISFSIFSVISKLGVLFLGVSFFLNSLCQRSNIEQNREFRLKEDDILRVARVILPFANLAISKTKELFSGEPSMTLKVAPFLVLGAEYGHLITLWRFCAIGFFFAFTVPKLYSCYAIQISQKVECLKWQASETWGACSHKKIVAASAFTAFWNLSTIKTRIFIAFISLVLLRYCQAQESDDKEVEGEENNQQALVLAEATNCQQIK